MNRDERIRAVAERFFDAIERGDVETVRDVYHPDVVIWHATDRTESSREENLAVLEGFVARASDRRYENRTLEVFADGFVQQHIVTGTRRDGMRLEMASCVICKVQDDRIVRLDEYFDSAALPQWFAMDEIASR
ncbi:nuclear transport factor 2 family protein [Novosphingobium sp. KN65.2]|uniref:nuclear transport factor 2 family protein n=1 Tax=Novosphingobium sp. KN65.2 TaxID=1478134 RepID=UPI0005DB9CFF|nr:nuclear transport factor 2 family protein [Novosphingobium sp. KN65.2]CDO37847.1 putative Ketosteroid isomerase-like protein [Novosphingobium sp. KN65.2]